MEKLPENHAAPGRKADTARTRPAQTPEILKTMRRQAERPMPWSMA
jgi:hypothetical protein